MARNRRPPRVTLVYALSGMVLLESLARELRSRGYEVQAWTQLTEDAYRSRKGWGAYGVRLRMWLVFPLRVCLRSLLARSRGPEVIVVTNTPFFLPVLVRLFASRRKRVVHLLWDLYPDQFYLAGKLTPKALLAKACAAITRATVKKCDATVFLGPRLQQWVEQQYGRPRQSWIIEVGADGSLLAQAPAAQPGRVRVLYAGNFGYAHDTGTLVRAMKLPVPDGMELVFHASGANYTKLRHETGDYVLREGRVTYAGPLSTEEWTNAMAAAQVALVTMRPGAEHILFPSKAYSAMLAGQALLAICVSGSDLAAMIGEADCGWVVEPGDVAGFHRVMEAIAADPKLVLRKRRNAWDYGRRRFDMPVIAARWVELFEELGCGRVGASGGTARAFTTRPMHHEDVRTVVRLHLRAFPGFFLSLLGLGFLREFYRSFTVDPMGRGFVAVDRAGRIDGVVVGSLNPAGYFRRLLWRRWWAFCLACASAVIRRPAIAPRLFRAVFYRGDPPAGPVRALLSSVAVNPAAQGEGVGRALVQRWVEEMRGLGAYGCFLTTDADGNDPVNAFYQRIGWRLDGNYATPEGRRMNRYVLDFGQ